MEYFQTTLTECYVHHPYGTLFWTAGQRIDPNSESTFVWRVTSTDTSAMTYTNWGPGQPDYGKQTESCMHLWNGHSYTWNDNDCSLAMCFVCELDI